MTHTEELIIPENASVAVRDLAKTKGFKEPSLAWKNGMQVGDGFTTQILRVTITEASTDGGSDSNIKPLSLIVKLPPNAKSQHDMSMLMFGRETHMYETILPALKEFQQKSNISEADGFYAFPKCYKTHYDVERGEAFIIMEDLRELGYNMENKYKVIGVEQAKLVIKTIARYHATSIALKHKEPALFAPFKELGDYFKDAFPESMLVDMTAANVANAMKTLNKPTDGLYREKLEHYRDHIIELMDSVWHAEPLQVPIHGDCWSNNFMFKYEVN